LVGTGDPGVNAWARGKEERKCRGKEERKSRGKEERKCGSLVGNDIDMSFPSSG